MELKEKQKKLKIHGKYNILGNKVKIKTKQAIRILLKLFKKEK